VSKLFIHFGMLCAALAFASWWTSHTILDTARTRRVTQTVLESADLRHFVASHVASVTAPAFGVTAGAVATNPKYKKLRAELEMFGSGKPKIIEWTQMKDALAGIGLLRYYAGDLAEGANQELVYTAIIDLWANKVVTIEPYSWGTNAAKWDWQAYSVVVTDPDGTPNEIKLRKPKPRPVAREEAVF